jgi:arsenate reductase
MNARPRVLFLCTGNSCRSQIAEGLLRQLGRGYVEVFSAGTEPRQLHPLAIQVMAEAGVDISSQHGKGLDEFTGQAFRFVITVCARAQERCPKWPGDVEYIHWSVDDPAAVEGSASDRLRAFRKAREEIRQRITLFLLANRLVQPVRRVRAEVRR